MDGYYEKKESRLNIAITNLGDFNHLIEKAKKEADQLQRTINQLSNFNLQIIFKDETVNLPEL